MTKNLRRPHKSADIRTGSDRGLESAFLPDDRRHEIRIELAALGFGAEGFPIFERKQDFPKSMRDASAAVTDELTEASLEHIDRLEGLTGPCVEVGKPERDARIVGMSRRDRFHF